MITKQATMILRGLGGANLEGLKGERGRLVGEDMHILHACEEECALAGALVRECVSVCVR